MTTTTFNELTLLNSLSPEAQAQHARKTYAKKSYFQHIFNQDQFDFPCKEHTQAFREEILRILLTKNVLHESIPLEDMHHHISQDLKNYNFNDGVNKISTFMYETDAQFQTIYLNFIRGLRQHFLHEPFYFQETPTIRIHCPHAENSHHYPRFHTDVSYGHPPEEFNLWLPLTEILEGHGFKVMSVENSNHLLERFNYDYKKFIENAIHNKDFSDECDRLALDVQTPLNSLLAFDSRSVHSGYPIKNHTRVSMDIRILPVSQYNKMEYCYQGLGRKKVFFTPGNCYHVLSSDEL